MRGDKASKLPGFTLIRHSSYFLATLVVDRSNVPAIPGGSALDDLGVVWSNTVIFLDSQSADTIR